MFTTGQYKFAIVFILAFVIAIIYSYRKDIFVHRKYYKKNYWVLLTFFAFLGMLFVIKTLLKKM